MLFLLRAGWVCTALQGVAVLEEEEQGPGEGPGVAARPEEPIRQQRLEGNPGVLGDRRLVWCTGCGNLRKVRQSPEGRPFGAVAPTGRVWGPAQRACPRPCTLSSCRKTVASLLPGCVQTTAWVGPPGVLSASKGSSWKRESWVPWISRDRPEPGLAQAVQGSARSQGWGTGTPAGPRVGAVGCALQTQGGHPTPPGMRLRWPWVRPRLPCLCGPDDHPGHPRPGGCG